MEYWLGVDLGTTYTAAAVLSAGQVQIVPLGDHEAAIPSVLLSGQDGGLLVGEPAERRSATSPGSTAREFKRRIGDPTPLLLDGVPYAAHALMAKLLGWVIDRVTDREGGPPTAVAVACPASWGEYRRELLAQAILQVDGHDVRLITEPEAAAVRYASQQRLDPGDVIGVYDLGGGTFDAAILRRTGDTFAILGRPAGVEHLGGVDFDEAVFGHVQRSIGPEAFEVDPDDLAVLAALHQLRRDCVQAKESLSYDTETLIPVNLPGHRTVVRLTRAEFEDMIRPLLEDTLVAFRRALASSGCGVEELTAVLLAGGSSRIPLVSHLLSGALGRRVAVDAHPKHIVALGAALLAGAGSAAPQDVSVPPAGGLTPAADVVTTAATGGWATDRAPQPDPAVPESVGTAAVGPQPVGTAAVGTEPVGTGPAARGLSARLTDPVGTTLLGTAAGCTATMLLVAGLGLGASVSGPPLGSDVRINGQPAGAGRAALVSLADDLTVTRAGQPVTGLTVRLRVLGLQVGTGTPTGLGRVSLNGLRYVVAGQSEADVQGGTAAAGVSGSAILDPSGSGVLTVPGVAGLGMLMFAGAYTESLLRPVRRRRRARATTLLAMGLVGCVAGVACALLGWVVLAHLLTIPVLLVCAVLGGVAGVALTLLLSRLDPRPGPRSPSWSGTGAAVPPAGR